MVYITNVRGGGFPSRSFTGKIRWFVDSEATDPSVDYSQALRAIGQVLERSKPRAFDVVCYGESYLVRCLTGQKKKSLLILLQRWREHNLPRAGPGSKPFMNVELLYFGKDIQEIDKKGKAKRGPSYGMPDPFSLSTLLRGVGDLVKSKGRFILASNRDRHIVVIYETSQGLRKAEEYETSSFYDIWVSMYLRRSQRASTDSGI